MVFNANVISFLYIILHSKLPKMNVYFWKILMKLIIIDSNVKYFVFDLKCLF